MKRFAIVLVIILAACAAYFLVFKKKDKGPSSKETALVLKKHSPFFNERADAVVARYMAVKNAFIEADTAAAKNATRDFLVALDSLPVAELDKDKTAVSATAQAAIEDVKANAYSLLAQNDITEMRKDFSAVTEMMYPSFLTAINYEGPLVFLEYCPMAFDDSIGANWLSLDREINNPYLGKKHPTYKAGMLHCGELKDSVGTN